MIADIVKVEKGIAPIEPGTDFPERADQLADWTAGTVTWEADDLAVVSASYEK